MEEAVLELLSAEDQDVLIVDLWPSCWKRDAGGIELGRQLIGDGKGFLRLEARYQHWCALMCKVERRSAFAFQRICVYINLYPHVLFPGRTAPIKNLIM